jgi:drug/metabolite transporter (DMT)-like permease
VLLPVVLVLYRRVSIRNCWHNVLVVVAVGAVLGAGQSVCFFKAIETIPTSIATLIMFTFPAATLIMERLTFGVSTSSAAAMSVPMAVAGAVLTLAPVVEEQTITVGLVWAAPVPLIYGLYLAFNSRVASRTPPLLRATLLQVGMALSFGGMVAAKGVDVPADFVALGLAVCCSLCSGLGVVLFASGIAKVSATTYSVLSGAELLTVVVVGVTLLNEELHRVQLLGMATIVVAMIFNATGFRRSSPEVAH